jgi:chromate transporter
MIYLSLIWTFLIIGTISFGGGFAMLPLLQRMLVDDWVSQAQFLDILAISQATPGAFAINAATFIGALVAPHPLLGSSLATISLSLPGWLLSTFVAYPMLQAKEHPYISILMNRLAPTTLGLVSYAGLSLLSSELTRAPNWQGINLFALLFVLIAFVTLRNRWLKSIKLIALMAVVGAASSFIQLTH